LNHGPWRFPRQLDASRAKVTWSVPAGVHRPGTFRRDQRREFRPHRQGLPDRSGALAWLREPGWSGLPN